jgi:uroporphyrinogen decarboxylase
MMSETMTSRERVLAALMGLPHDRVPYMELYVDEHLARRALNLPPVSQPSRMSGDRPVTVDYFGGSSYDPQKLAETLGLESLLISAQPQIYFETDIRDGQYFVTGGQVRKRADLAKVQLHDPDDLSIYEPARRFLEKYRPTGLALGCFINLGADPVTLSMGWDQFSYALYDDPTMLHTLFDVYSDWSARAVRHLCGMGFYFIWAGDDIAFRSGPMISPRFFRQFFMPYFKRVAENISLPWIFHTDSNFLPLLDDLLTLGMNGLHPNEPDAVDIRHVKQLVGDRLTLVGNIDISVLSLGTPEQVEVLTNEVIRNVGRDGRLILSSSNSLARSCKMENVLAMQQACLRSGVYPIE